MGDDLRELVLVGLKVRYRTVEGHMVIAVAAVQHAIEGRARILIDMVVADDGAIFHVGWVLFLGTAYYAIRYC